MVAPCSTIEAGYFKDCVLSSLRIQASYEPVQGKAQIAYQGENGCSQKYEEGSYGRGITSFWFTVSSTFVSSARRICCNKLVSLTTTTPSRRRGSPWRSLAVAEDKANFLPFSPPALDVEAVVVASVSRWEAGVEVVEMVRGGEALIQERAAHCTAGRSSQGGNTQDSWPGREGGRKGNTTPAESRSSKGRWN